MTEEYDEGSQIPELVIELAKRELYHLIDISYMRAFKECFPDYPDNAYGS